MHEEIASRKVHGKIIAERHTMPLKESGADKSEACKLTKLIEKKTAVMMMLNSCVVLGQYRKSHHGQIARPFTGHGVW